jgi:hypothetical protein
MDVIIVIILYFLPFFIGAARGAGNQLGILIVNVALGWTGIGWLGALVWAVSAAPGRDRERRRMIEQDVLMRLSEMRLSERKSTDAR